MTTHNSVAAFTFAAATLFSILSSPAPAQQVGYINGETIQSFDLSTGQILSSFQQVANVAPIAVSKDGNTLYSPQDNGSTGSVHVLSASDGSLLSVIPGVTKSPHQTRLSPSGNYVYVMSVYTASRKAWVSVLDLNAGKVVRYIHTSPGYPLDIALSPDGKQLFLASLSAPAEVESAETQETHDTSVPISGCPLSSGICVFDTATFKLTGLVFGVTGFLAASQDGNTLYCLPQEGNPTPIYAINTASLKSSAITVPNGQFPRRIAVSPSGNVAVLQSVDDSGTLYAYLIDSQTNQITGPFAPPQAPGVFYPGSDLTAFSRDGTSLWSLGDCPAGQCTTLVGQSFPSGGTIGQTVITQLGGVSAVTF